MKKKLYRRFPALMIGSMLLLSPALLLKIGLEKRPGAQKDEGAYVESLVREEGTLPAQGGPLTLPGASEQASQSLSRTEAGNDKTVAPEAVSSVPSLTENETTPEETTQEKRAPSMEEFFSTVLFIGDSRSVGLYEYAGLEGADFFATSGMSVFRLWEKEVSVPGVGKLTLEELLKQKQYDTIFLMTGINELGYEHTAIVKRYGDTMETIQALQPETVLYVCANLHVTKDRSDRDEIYNNEQIDWLNGEIAGLAEESPAVYLDVNPLFDDEQGALRSDYSGDDTHPYGKYYQEWGRWLYETCVQTPRPSQETD